MEEVKAPDSLVVPSGELLLLEVEQIKASTNNPRRLFDPEPMASLKKSIREHGVLVPLTVYRPKGQKKYTILDGQRRFACCVSLTEDGIEVKVPANVVEPPTEVAGLIYMFSIHNFREEWELMPTALGLKKVMDKLNVRDTKELNRTTGLSIPQIERCKKLLEFPEKYTRLSLEVDPQKRIPSNFWIEALPVIELCEKELPELIKEHGRDWIIEQLITKYRSKAVKSVIHFRAIMNAYNASEKSRKDILDTLKTYILTPEMDTKDTFYPLADESLRVGGAVEAANKFKATIDRARLEFISGKEHRDQLLTEFTTLITYLSDLNSKLEGDDDPTLA